MSPLLTPTIINENTQLGKVVSLLKRLECHFHAEDQKSMFRPPRNAFRSETNLPSCVFSFIIIGFKTWLILKKSIFSIFYRYLALLKRAQNGRSASDDVVASGEKNLKTWFYHLHTLGSCRGTSQLSVNIIWASRGCLKLQKLDFFKKIFPKWQFT